MSAKAKKAISDHKNRNDGNRGGFFIFHHPLNLFHEKQLAVDCD
jgi:hypothetical protein